MEVKNAGTNATTAFIKMIVFLRSTYSGKDNHMPVIRAARFSAKFIIFCMLLTVIMAATPARSLYMTRMYILTICSADDSRYERPPASATGVHIKAYDTQRVP